MLNIHYKERIFIIQMVGQSEVPQVCAAPQWTNLTDMFFDCGRKAEDPHAGMQRTCTVHTEKPGLRIEPGTHLL